MAIQSAMACSEVKDDGPLVSWQLMECVLVWIVSSSLAVEDGIFLWISVLASHKHISTHSFSEPASSSGQNKFQKLPKVELLKEKGFRAAQDMCSSYATDAIIFQTLTSFYTVPLKALLADDCYTSEQAHKQVINEQ